MPTKGKRKPAQAANLAKLEQRIQEQAASFAKTCTRMVLQEALEALGGPIVEQPNGVVAASPTLAATATPLPAIEPAKANGEAKAKYKDMPMMEAISDVLTQKGRSFPKEVADELKAHGYPFHTKAPHTTVAQRLYDMADRKMVVGRDGTIPGTKVRVKWYTLRQ